MNLDTASQAIQQGFRVTVGAAASLVEGLQNPQQYQDTVTRIQQGDLNQLTEEWAVKGEQTEQDARRFVETMMTRSPGSTPTGSPSTPSGPVIPVDLKADLADLTQEIIQLRQALEGPEDNTAP